MDYITFVSKLNDRDYTMSSVKTIDGIMTETFTWCYCKPEDQKRVSIKMSGTDVLEIRVEKRYDIADGKYVENITYESFEKMLEEF